MEQVQPSIEDMNEPIALFMEIEKQLQEWRKPQPVLCFMIDKYWTPVAKLKYHTSWDWLHPVWVKFRDLKFTEETSMKLHLNYVARLSQNMVYDTIAEFHYRLYIAITWYNQQKQSI